MTETCLVMGIDFGTDSVRVILVDAKNGDIAGKGIANYRRWADQLYCQASENRFRQHPADYLESLDKAAQLAFSQAGNKSGRFLESVCVDSTGSTPAPVDRSGRPLALLPEFSDNPNAMFFLWKDHTASAEAAEFNSHAASWPGEDYLRYQGLYSSEWFWAKILKAVRSDKKVREAAWNWIEECEWITAELCGGMVNFPRSATAAGHKALWHSSFAGLPARDFLIGLDSYLGAIYDRYRAPVTPDKAVGLLGRVWRERWQTREGVMVAGSLFDAHAGAVACGVRPGVLVKVIGTSAVDMAVEKPENIKSQDTRKLFGMAENSIIPGYTGIEAGQAAFGDAFKWLEQIISWQSGETSENTSGRNILTSLNSACEKRPPPTALALDWFNGRRYPDGNDNVKAGIFNLDLGVDAPGLYQALSLGVVFGAKRILAGMLASGITIREIICAGGVARKSTYTMQLLADVLDMDISVSACDEACAKGAAMYAACAAGLQPSLFAAQEALGDGFLKKYKPNQQFKETYRCLYKKYLAAGYFIEENGISHTANC